MAVKRMNVPGPKAKALIERDKKVISPSCPRVYPFAMSRGKGSEVWDVDGNRYIDLTTGISVASTGHLHPRVVHAIKSAADEFLHISGDYYHNSMVELAEKLNEIVSIKENCRTFFTNSGTESVEGALKLARFATGRPRFIGFIGGFHGRSMGSLAFTASKPKQQKGFFPTMPGVVHVPFPNPYRPLFVGEDQGKAVLNYIEKVLFKTMLPSDEVAAVLVEPIQGEGGYVIPPASFLPGLRELCDRHGILMIADEVQSGFGRTGKWFAVDHWGVEPDIFTFAKGIASGMPIGAFTARESVMEKWTNGTHGNTYGGNPLCVASAMATIAVIEDEKLLDNAAKMGDYMLEKCRDMMNRHPMIGDVRGRGLMIGLEMVKDRETKEPASKEVDRAMDLAFEHGLLLLPCGNSTLRFMAALNITRDLIDEAFEIFEHVLYIVQEEAASA